MDGMTFLFGLFGVLMVAAAFTAVLRASRRHGGLR